jgi:hypothetical protein
MKTRIALSFVLLATITAVAIQTTRAKAPTAAPKSLTAYVPQDALLSIESPDFAALLHRWTSSPQSKSWLASDNYSVFQNSRLFGRLSDAQDQFAKAAGVPAGTSLLNQVAGTQSVFAWYDVGKLEFLYITRMPAAQANQSQLLQSRASFQRRHAGNADFYIRTSSQDYSTVAFAQVSTPSGDLLLLATREDLIANALTLIAANSPTPSPAQSLAQEPWFTEASAALPQEKTAPALHMVLNLDRIVPMPSFRSYWVQRNITWMKQYRAAVSDLYLEPTRFREERVLLPNSIEPPSSTPDIAALAALAPPSTGVFRALATQDPSVAITSIQEKLLGAYTPESESTRYAPDPNLETPQSGSASDLETRIDTPAPVSASASYEALTQTLQTTGLDAVLTLSTAQPPATKEGLWVPIHSAVVLHATTPWNPQTLASSLQQSLRGSLTAANLGIEFRPVTAAGQTLYTLTGPRPLFFAIPAPGNLAFLSDDQTLLLSLLNQPPPSAKSVAGATLIAGFDHTSQRAPYLRLTSLIDGTNNPTPGTGTDVTSTPTFFSRNLNSLSSTFATLQSERLTQRTVDSNLRQTVTYTWQTP